MTEREELQVAQQQVIRLEALLDASRRIHSTTDLDTVLQTALRIVVQELELTGAFFQPFPLQPWQRAGVAFRAGPSRE